MIGRARLRHLLLVDRLHHGGGGSRRRPRGARPASASRPRAAAAATGAGARCRRPRGSRRRRRCRHSAGRLRSLPNRRSDTGDTLDYNSVDAALWFVVAVDDLLREALDTGYAVREGRRLAQAVAAILDGYVGGTRYGIGLDKDGLLRAGEPGVQLTWMDAKVGDWVVTPRIGKPVEVEALWINALRIAQRWSPRWAAAEHAARTAFAARFPNPATGGLFDVVDADHVPGRRTTAVRPNQIFAVGGLPYPVLEARLARGVVDLVEAKLLTPLGLRSLAREDPDYVPRLSRRPTERDAAYHQGTVWPWLIGPFVEAWLRVRGNTAAAKVGGPDPLPAAAAAAPRDGGTRPCLRSSGRRSTPHPRRLPVPGLVARRTDPGATTGR